MNAIRFLALALVLEGAACGGGTQSAPPPEPQPEPAAPAILKITAIKITDQGGQSIQLHEDGRVELSGKGVVATMYADGRLVTADGKEIKLAPDGTVSLGGEALPGKIGDDGSLTVGDKTVSIGPDGTLVGGNPQGPTMKVEGATEPMAKKAAMFLLVLTMPPQKAEGGGGAPKPEVAAADTKAVDDQVAKGKQLYADKCASCHGDSGEGGGKTPAVVGKDALPLEAPKVAKKRKGVKFETAKDVLDWTKKNMPLKKPGSLTDEEYAAIMAFDLSANGVKVTKPVDFTNAAEIKLR
jgi:mono/diheme cytochrome c family protein